MGTSLLQPKYRKLTLSVVFLITSVIGSLVYLWFSIQGHGNGFNAPHVFAFLSVFFIFGRTLSPTVLRLRIHPTLKMAQFDHYARMALYFATGMTAIYSRSKMGEDGLGYSGIFAGIMFGGFMFGTHKLFHKESKERFESPLFDPSRPVSRNNILGVLYWLFPLISTILLIFLAEVYQEALFFPVFFLIVVLQFLIPYYPFKQNWRENINDFALTITLQILGVYFLTLSMVLMV